MGRGDGAHVLPAPWSFRLVEMAPVGPAWMGVAVALSILGAYLVVESATGGFYRVVAEGDAHLAMHFRISSVNAALLGYLTAAQVYLSRWTRKHAEELRPLLRTSDAAPIDPLTSRGRRAAGATGCILLPMLFLVLPDPDLPMTPAYWIPEHVWDWLMLPPIGWMGGRFAYALIAGSLAFSRIATKLDRIDLLDVRSLSPFVSQGLRSALLAILFLSIGTGLVGIAVISPVSGLVTMGSMLILATIALILPVRGVHERIREEKRTRLAEIRRKVRASEAALDGDEIEADRAKAGLPGLLAFEARIEAVREWPFDAPSLGRFALYVSVGIGSWVGAATVERLIDRALD